MILRGSLAQGVALAVIDVLGFLLAHRLLYRRIDAGGDPAGPELTATAASTDAAAGDATIRTAR